MSVKISIFIVEPTNEIRAIPLLLILARHPPFRRMHLDGLHSCLGQAVVIPRNVILIRSIIKTQSYHFLVSLVRLNQSPGHGRVDLEIAEYFVRRLVNTNHRVFSRHASSEFVSSAGSDSMVAAISGVAIRAFACETDVCHFVRPSPSRGEQVPPL